MIQVRFHILLHFIKLWNHTALVLFAKFSNNELSIVFCGFLAEICFKSFEFEISLNAATFIDFISQV